MWRCALALLLLVFLPSPGKAAPCNMSGGGCLTAYEGAVRLQSVFGGTVPGTWDHRYFRDRTPLAAMLSTDAHIVGCRPDPSAGCAAPRRSSRIEFDGACQVTLTDQPPFPGNISASVIDVGICDGVHDRYSITVRRVSIPGLGEVVYEASGELGCGNLRVDAPWVRAR